MDNFDLYIDQLTQEEYEREFGGVSQEEWDAMNADLSALPPDLPTEEEIDRMAQEAPF